MTDSTVFTLTGQLVRGSAAYHRWPVPPGTWPLRVGPDPLHAMDGMVPEQVQLNGVLADEPPCRVVREWPWLSAAVPWSMPQVCPKLACSRRLPRTAGRSAHEGRDEAGDAEKGQERKEHNAGGAVLSGHEAHDPGVEEQAPAKHDNACPEATLSERRERHRGESTPERDG